MAKDPAVLFYTSDFISGTLTMNHEQRGKYILLLCLQHQQGYLTEEDMLNICERHDAKIFKKFAKNEEGLYFNERMLRETTRRKEYSQSRRNNRLTIKDENGDNINVKKKDMSKTSLSHDKHMETETETETIIINEAKDYIGNMVEVFHEIYLEIRGVEYEATNIEKERSAAGKLARIYKKKFPDNKTDQALEELGNYFRACLTIDDQWLFVNMSLPIIISKFNEINTILKHGNKRKTNKGGATNEELAGVIAKHFASKPE